MIKKLQLACILYLLAWLLCPPLMYGTSFRLLALISSACWILCESLKTYKEKATLKRGLEKFSSNYVIATLVYVLGEVLIQLLFYNTTLFNIIYNNIQIYILLVIGFIGTRYVSNKRFDELKVAFIAIVLFCVVFSITAIFRGSEYQGVTREAGGESKYTEAFLQSAARRGIGGFGFFSFTAILSPVLVYFALAVANKKGIKFITIISAIICEMGVISAGYTLALTISVIGIFAVLITTIKSDLGKILLVLTAIIILVLGQQIMSLFYGLFKRLFSGTMYENKIEDIFTFLIEGESQGTFANRLERYLQSFKSIFKYPILGSVIFNGTKSIGSHSSILDSLAAYGWIIGFSWLYLITIYHNQVMKHLKVRIGVRVALIIMIVLTALFNRVVMTLGALYFVIPYIASCTKKGDA